VTRYADETERARHHRAQGIWNNDGSLSVRAPIDEQYGRRIEPDRSWTIYHVFTGLPASREGHQLIGLSRSVATNGMLSLNRRRDRRRIECTDGHLPAPILAQAAGGDRQ
jgi:hypothetical protein